jgi:ABC-type transport system substrate-binding protein
LPTTAWGGVTAPDSTTVVVTLKTPLSLDQLIQNWCILPEGSRDLGAKLQNESVGTGPFILADFVRGNSIELARNDDYWADGPYLDQLKFVFLSSIAARLSNFSSGTVNMLHSVGVTDLESVENLPNAKLVRSGTLWHHWAPLMRSGALSTTEARLALRYAFDVEKLNEVAWKGHGVAYGNPYELTPYFAKDADTWPASYDVDRARSLLSAAGVSGGTVNLYVLSGSTNSELEAQILVEDFGRAGLKSKIVPQDSTTWTNGYYTEQSNEGLTNNFLPLYFPWRGNAQQMLQPQALPAPPQWPTSPVPEVFAAYEETQSAYTDEQLQTALTSLQQRLGEYAPAYPTWAGPLNEVVPQNLEGLETTDFGVVRFGNAYLA